MKDERAHVKISSMIVTDKDNAFSSPVVLACSVHKARYDIARNNGHHTRFPTSTRACRRMHHMHAPVVTC